MNAIYKNANEAFKHLYDKILHKGSVLGDTRCLYNIGFYLTSPLDNKIDAEWRKWKQDYAEFEWEWYLSGDPSAIEIAKHAKIWNNCMDENGNVNSNYGYQWKRGDQIKYVVEELRNNNNSRRASVSIYDAKVRYNFENDTPCTYAIHFYIRNNELCMSVMMRSNDLWFGFCNDQYCFSRLQEMISKELCIEIGTYHHFVNNLHLYDKHLNKKEQYYESINNQEDRSL